MRSGTNPLPGERIKSPYEILETQPRGGIEEMTDPQLQRWIASLDAPAVQEEVAA